MSSNHSKPAAERPYTELCTHSQTSIHYRDDNLAEDILGQRGFTDVLFSQILGRRPDVHDLRVLDAALIAIMEHGLTPSAIATRMVYMSSPENIQSGVAAGLLPVRGHGRELGHPAAPAHRRARRRGGCGTHRRASAPRRAQAHSRLRPAHAQAG